MNVLPFCLPSTNHLLVPYSHFKELTFSVLRRVLMHTHTHLYGLILSVLDKYIRLWRCLVPYYVDNALLIECADECLVSAVWRAGMATTVLTEDQLLHTLDHLPYSSPAQHVLVGPLAWITSIIKQVGCVINVWEIYVQQSNIFSPASRDLHKEIINIKCATNHLSFYIVFVLYIAWILYGFIISIRYLCQVAETFPLLIDRDKGCQ